MAASAAEASAKFFQSQLKSQAGTEARRYLERRGLNEAGIARFRLGFAPGGRSALKEHLASAGFTPAEMIRSGMLISGDDIPVAYDRFRNRVMFPITDMKGRPIALRQSASSEIMPSMGFVEPRKGRTCK